MVWPNRGAFGAIGGYGLNVLKLLQGSHRCCRYAPALGFNKAHKTIRQAQAPSPVFFVEAPGRPVFLSPPDTRGWRARGRCRRRFKIRISLRKCGSASRRATRTSLKCPGSFAAVFFRFAHSRKRNACAGPRFPGRRPDRGFPPIRGCREPPPGLPSLSDGLSGKKLRASLNGCTVSQLLAGGSYWPPGGAPAPPECVGGAFVSRPRAPHPAPSSDAS